MDFINRISTLAEMKFAEMKAFNDRHKDLPDGAFFGLAAEQHNWTTIDWLWFSKECERRGTYQNKSKKSVSETPQS